MCSSSAVSDPKIFIKNLGDKAISIINKSDITQVDVQKEFKTLLNQNFAMDRISKFSLGKYNKQLDNSQKEMFLTCFINMLVKAYSSSFNEYKTANFTITNVKQKKDTHYLVYSKIKIDGQEPIDIIWSVYFIKNQMKVFDVIISNVSISKAQRDEINSRIKEIGMKKFLEEFNNKYGELK